MNIPYERQERYEIERKENSNRLRVFMVVWKFTRNRCSCCIIMTKRQMSNCLKVPIDSADTAVCCIQLSRKSEECGLSVQIFASSVPIIVTELRSSYGSHGNSCTVWKKFFHPNIIQPVYCRFFFLFLIFFLFLDLSIMRFTLRKIEFPSAIFKIRIEYFSIYNEHCYFFFN